MINHDLAFVVRRFLPEKQKISVVSQYQGKINLTVASLQNCQKIWPGSLISYVLDAQSARIKRGNQVNHGLCERIEILYVPSLATGHELFWVHHFLEICYYFLPLEQPCPDVFLLFQDALRVMVEKPSPYYHFLMQRLCMVKLLELVGLLAPPFNHELKLFDGVLRQAVDEQPCAKIELTRISLQHDIQELLAALDVWILNSLKTHPNFNSFKVLNFLQQTPDLLPAKTNAPLV